MTDNKKNRKNRDGVSRPVKQLVMPVDAVAERLFDAIFLIKSNSFSEYSLEENIDRIEADAKIYFENYEKLRRNGFGFAERNAYIEMFKHILEKA